MQEELFMAFDFGLARTGVAIGSSLIGEATPVGIIDTRSNDERWAVIESLVDEWQPTAFVVGVPRHGDGSATELTPRSERFARQLGGRFHRKVHCVDERFSSVVVENGQERIDDMAAVVILQQFFDEQYAALNAQQ